MKCNWKSRGYSLEDKEHYRYTEAKKPVTNDIVWKTEDITLSLCGVFSLVQNFVRQYPHKDYNLSVVDNITGKTIEIECDIEEIPQIVDYIYYIENGTPFSFIETDSAKKKYVVGMSVRMHRIGFCFYRIEDHKLKKV